MEERRTFEFDGKTYEVQMVISGNTTTIRTYLDGEAVNGYSYVVNFEDRFAAYNSKTKYDLLNEMVKLAINDVKDNTWERAIRAART